jgi:ribosome-binding protein aMBF1 (putative translation factor)
VNKKHIGGRFSDSLQEWKKDPAFVQYFELAKEKDRLAWILKETREKEGLTQAQLAQKASVTQSVIARIESTRSTVLPRLDIFNGIMHAMGYKTLISIKKEKILAHA